MAKIEIAVMVVAYCLLVAVGLVAWLAGLPSEKLLPTMLGLSSLAFSMGVIAIERLRRRVAELEQARGA